MGDIPYRDRLVVEWDGSGGDDAGSLLRIVIHLRQEVVGQVDDKDLRDAAIIASAQAIEHYEINRYGTLIAWAQQLGYRETVDEKQLGNVEIVDLLQLSLDEEKDIDRKLTALAESRVNRHAA